MTRHDGQRCYPLPLLLEGLLLLLSLLGLAQRVEAHANLLRAVPESGAELQQPPDRVTLWFSERIAPGLSTMQVLDTQGQRVEHDDNTVDHETGTALGVTLSPVPHGLYTVAWKNVSMVDGHRVRGAFVFAVGESIRRGPVSTPAPPLFQSPRAPVLRGVVLCSALAVVGGLGFVLLVAHALLAGRTTPDPVWGVGTQVVARTVWHIWIALGVLLVGSVGQLVDHTAVATELPFSATLGRPLGAILTGTDWGRLWLARVGVLGLLALVLGAPRPRRTLANATRGARSLRLLGATALGGLVLLTLSLTSHGAATLEVRVAAIGADYLHVLAAAFWGGGLFHFACGLAQGLWTAPPEVRRAVLATLVPRFSLLACLCVGILLITGGYNTWVQVTELPALATPYGVTLLVKLGLVVPLLGLGALNLRWVRPRLAREDRAGTWLRRLVMVEALLVVVILAATGVLTSLEPARHVAAQYGRAAGRPLTVEDMVEGLHITLTVTPGRVGLNRVRVALRDRRGTPVRNAAQVEVRLEALDADLGEHTALATAHEDGAYVLEDALLSLVGQWQIQLVVRRPDAFDARAAFRVAIPAGEEHGRAAMPLSPRTGTLLWGGALLLVGGLFVATTLPLQGHRTALGRLVMGAGVGCAVAALGFLVLLPAAGTDTRAPVRNPFPPTTASVETGQRLYAQRCTSCHGRMGRGDGPLAAGLRPPPADLVVHVPQHADHDLFVSIHDGITGTAMAPFGGQMTDEEIWHTINYLKTLGQ